MDLFSNLQLLHEAAMSVLVTTIYGRWRGTTTTAIIVTIIFIVSLGYDLWYYILGYSGVFEYKLNSPLQVSEANRGFIVFVLLAELNESTFA